MSTATHPETMTSSGVNTGDFVWYELRTTDARKAEDFYTHVVGWKTQPSGDPGGMPYTILAVGDAPVAGLMELTPEMLAGGLQPSWAGFIGVPNVDEYANRIEQSGGKLHFPPQDIPGIGRFASVEDPQGASFLLFTPLPHGEMPPRPVSPAPGTIGWHELSANDEASAWTFYSKLFEWQDDTHMDMGPMGIYRIFNHGGPQIGAMLTRDRTKAPHPHWLYYIHVEDIDAAVARIQEKKGQVFMGPHEVPGNLWIVIGSDPLGATFALVGPKKK